MSKASWAGAKMVMHQLCYEAPPLFLLFQSYFHERDFFVLEKAALANDNVGPEQWKQFIAYVAGFYGNLSNYHSFGHSKFIPECSCEVFKQILMSNPSYENNHAAFYKRIFEDLWPQVEQELYSIEKPYTNIGFPSEGGVTGYFGRNMSKDDLKLVQEFLVDQKIDILNTRAFKTDDKKYTITVGSIDKEKSKENVDFKECKFDI